MKKKIITQKNIAEALGVTPVTVSKALRDSSDISPEMKERVKKMAEELAYHPNLLAKSLSSRRTHMIGAIVPEITTSFFAAVIEGFYDEGRKHGYEIILMISHEKSENEASNVSYLASLGVEGLVLSVTSETNSRDFLSPFLKRDLPIVFYDRPIRCPKTSTVTIDDAGAAQRVVERLIEKGYRKIAFLGPTELPRIIKNRFLGYQAALKKHGLSFDKKRVIPCDFSKERAFQAMADVLQDNVDMDALFCANDFVAMSAYRAITQAGLAVPDDIGLAGFGNMSETFFLPAPFITISQPAYEMGRKAVEVLIENLEHKSENRKTSHIQLDTELVERN